jgi:hypothetical protein
MIATLANLARAPNAPVNFVATGNATQGVTVTFSAAPGDKVEKFIVAARATTENFYSARVSVEAEEERGVVTASVTPQQLNMTPGQSFFISVAAQGDGRHESLFAYPEYRCDAAACVVPPDATATTVFK